MVMISELIWSTVICKIASQMHGRKLERIAELSMYMQARAAAVSHAARRRQPWHFNYKLIHETARAIHHHTAATCC